MPLVDPNDAPFVRDLLLTSPGLWERLGLDGMPEGENPLEWMSRDAGSREGAESQSEGISNIQQGISNDEGGSSEAVPPAYAEQLNYARGVADRLYPVADGLDAGESEELFKLSNRARRLSPIAPAQFGDVGSARIAGNPYSIDTRGAASGVRNLVTGIINKVREKRTDGFSDRLSELSTKKKTAQESQAERDAFLEKFFPEVFKQEQQNIRNDADNKSLEARNTADNTRIANENALDRTHKTELEKLKNTPADKVNSQDISNFRMFTQGLIEDKQAAVESIESELEKLKNQAVGLESPDNPQGSKELRETYARMNKLEDQRLKLETDIRKKQTELDRVIREKAGVSWNPDESVGGEAVDVSDIFN